MLRIDAHGVLDKRCSLQGCNKNPALTYPLGKENLVIRYF